LLNAEEMPGDEGAIFSLLLCRGPISNSERAELCGEDVHAVIKVDGRWVPVELAVINGTNGDDGLIGTLIREGFPLGKLWTTSPHRGPAAVFCSA
jgi:hypothetical protein